MLFPDPFMMSRVTFAVQARPVALGLGDPCWKNAFSECLKREAGSITDLLTQIGEAAACAGVCIAAAEHPRYS